jgi:hypothetical protein
VVPADAHHHALLPHRRRRHHRRLHPRGLFRLPSPPLMCFYGLPARFHSWGGVRVFPAQIISPYHLYLNPKLVVQQYEIWRLVTNFLYFRKMGMRSVPLSFINAPYPLCTGRCELLSPYRWHAPSCMHAFYSSIAQQLVKLRISCVDVTP